MDPSITKQCTLVDMFFGKVLILNIPWAGIRGTQVFLMLDHSSFAFILLMMMPILLQAIQAISNKMVPCLSYMIKVHASRHILKQPKLALGC